MGELHTPEIERDRDREREKEAAADQSNEILIARIQTIKWFQ